MNRGAGAVTSYRFVRVSNGFAWIDSVAHALQKE
jgi:hypothetical protein